MHNVFMLHLPQDRNITAIPRYYRYGDIMTVSFFLISMLSPSFLTVPTVIPQKKCKKVCVCQKATEFGRDV